MLLRRFWTEEVVDYHGTHHTVTAAGINPFPVQRPIPLWFGGQSKYALERTGRLADGWFPYYPFFSEELLRQDYGTIQQSARDAGRDPGAVQVEGAIYFQDDRFPMPAGGRTPPHSLEECIEYAHWWESFGATRFWVTAPWVDLGPEETGVRDPDKSWSGVDLRIKALAEFKDAWVPGASVG